LVGPCGREQAGARVAALVGAHALSEFKRFEELLLGE
jgi:hypothetical protein